jgi:hypothetical protein
MTKKFIITKDDKGIPSYGIEIAQTRKLGGSVGAGAIVNVAIEEGELYALISSSVGTDYLVSSSTIASDYTVVATGNPLLSTESFQNISLIGLQNWESDTIFIRPRQAAFINVIMFGRNDP